MGKAKAPSKALQHKRHKISAQVTGLGKKLLRIKK
jgi:hypothetical protein